MRLRLTRSSDRAALLDRISENEALAERLASASDDASQQDRAHALWGIAKDLVKLGRYDDALSRYAESEEVYRRFTSWRDAAVNVALDHARALLHLERYEEAVAIYERIFNEVGFDKVFPEAVAHDPRLADIIPLSVSVWLGALQKIGDIDRIAAAAAAVVEALDAGGTGARRAAVAEAFRLQAKVAHERADRELALRLLEETIVRCDRPGEVDLQGIGAMAMADRALVLVELGRTDEAIAALDECLTRFGSVDDEVVRETLKGARDLRRRLARRP